MHLMVHACTCPGVPSGTVNRQHMHGWPGGPGTRAAVDYASILQCDGKPTIALAAASRSFRPHPLLQLLGAERRRPAFPAAIPPACPSPVPGVAPERDEGRRIVARMYIVLVCAHLGLGFARRHCLMAELGFGRGTMLLCAVCSRAASVRRWR